MNELFDAPSDSRLGPPLYSESRFDYLNSSTRRIERRVRTFWDTAFQSFPESGKVDVRRRFRSVDNYVHEAAGLELYSNSLLNRLGFRTESHPPVFGARQLPDFRGTSDNGNAYVECLLVTGYPREALGRLTLVDQLKDTINSVASPGYFISFALDGLPDASTSRKRLRNHVQQWLEALAGGAGEDSTVIEVGRAKVRLIAFPAKRRAKITSPLGLEWRMLGREASAMPVLDGLRRKAKAKYPTDLPLVAILGTPFATGPEMVAQALFGRKLWNLDQATLRYVSTTYALDGLWNAAGRGQQTSAVIHVRGFDAWRAPRCTLTLFENPWADRPLSGLFAEIGGVRAVDGVLKSASGRPPEEIFSVPQDWPEQARRVKQT